MKKQTKKTIQETEPKICGRCNKLKGEKETDCNCGRPILYSEAILKKADEYLVKLPEDEVIHSIEGLAIYLKINRDTVYAWEKEEDKKQFSDIVREVRQRQARTLINGGLSGVLNAPITKVMLSKHDYREGIENTGKDGKDLIPEVLKPEEKEALLGLLKK